MENKIVKNKENQSKFLRTTEYQFLYQEILENSRNIYIILQVYSVGTTAIFTGIVTIFVQFFNQNLASRELIIFALSFLFLIPVFLAIPSMALVNSLLNSTTRIASYLRVVYDENKNDFGVVWQERLQKLRDLEKTKRNVKYRFFADAILSLFTWTCLICIVASASTEILLILYLISVQNFQFFNPQSFGDYIIHSIVFAYVVLFIVLFKRFHIRRQELKTRFSSEYFVELTKEWKTILQEESTLNLTQQENP